VSAIVGFIIALVFRAIWYPLNLIPPETNAALSDLMSFLTDSLWPSNRQIGSLSGPLDLQYLPEMYSRAIAANALLYGFIRLVVSATTGAIRRVITKSSCLSFILAV